MVEELNNPEIARLFASVERLHANHYHNFLKLNTFKIHKVDVGKLIDEVRKVAR